MDDYRLPDSEILALKPSDKVILHKTLKVKREADKVKAVYLLGSGHPVKLTAEVRDWLARHKKIKLHFLPGYSPNLNLIERLWKFFNEKVRNNRYYGTFSQFTEACKNFFRCRKKWTEELRTRLAQNFHRFKTNISSN